MVRIITFAVIMMLAEPVSVRDFDNGMATVVPNEAAPAPISQEVLIADGESIYRNRCSRCHGRNGEGQWYGHDAAPRLGENITHLSVKEIVVQIIQGGSYMPPFPSLTNQEIAAVITYIWKLFGNNHGIITEEEIMENRVISQSTYKKNK